MAETPETVEVNVVMGAQTRAIVRSALIHVKNRVGEELPGKGFPGSVDSAVFEMVNGLFNEELDKWPLAVAPEQPDTLPEWLYNRFSNQALEWVELEVDARQYWEHQAAAVRRAVGRGGFKRDGSPKPQFINVEAEVVARHQTLGDHLQSYWEAGVPMVSVSQVRDILTGRANPAEYSSALQVRPEQRDVNDHG